MIRQIMGVLVASTAFAQTLAEWGPLMSEGERLNKQGQYAEAFRKYEMAAGAALKAEPAAEAQFRMAQMLEKRGDPGQALLWYRKSLERMRDEDIVAAVKRLETARGEQLVTAREIVSVFKSAATKSSFVEPSIDLPVNFDFDKSSLTGDGVKQVVELGNALHDPVFVTGRFQIIGHTDKRGTVFHNQELSEQRARAVRDRLSAQFGINPNRVDVVGMGCRQPLVDGETEEDYRLNRRVEVKWIE